MTFQSKVKVKYTSNLSNIPWRVFILDIMIDYSVYMTADVS